MTDLPAHIDNELDPVAYLPEDRNPKPDHFESSTQEAMRPVFRLEQFVIARWKSGREYICRGCGLDHRVWTHGCRPVAWGIAHFANDPDVLTEPATPDSVPFSITDKCPLHSGSMVDPHEHQDFRWQ
jgi:hypothetical protein